MTLTRKQSQLLLAALLLYFAAWDLRAVLADNRPGIQFTDTTLVDVVELRQSGGDGGILAVSPEGEIVMTYNSEGMKRAAASSTKEIVVRTFAT